MNGYMEVVGKEVEIGLEDEFTGRNFLMDLIIFNESKTEVIKLMELAEQYGLDINQKDEFWCALLHRERELVLRWLS